MFDRIPKFLKNKYSLSIIVFVIWIAFFDQNNMMIQMENKIELWNLEEDRTYYQEEILKTNRDLEELTTDMKSLERFAREKYLMKRDNEEVFVIVREE